MDAADFDRVTRRVALAALLGGYSFAVVRHDDKPDFTFFTSTLPADR